MPGFDLLAQVREAAIQERYTKLMVPIVDFHLAQERTRRVSFYVAVVAF
jgi:hypothetical protein